MSGLYDGELVHVRRDRWAARRFRYRLYTACLDLDELPALRLRLLSYNRPNLFAIRDRDYAMGAPDLARGARAFLAAHGLPRPHRLELITQLRVLGYVFNPASFFLGYDAAGALESAILEVNNTYGGRHCYAIDPRRPSVDRTFFVSPFLPGAARYDLRFDGARPDAPRLDVRMDVRRPDGDRAFLARLTGERLPLDDRTLLRLAIRHPLMPVQVIGLIHWQAMKLHWARVPYRRPGPDHAAP